MIVISKRHCQWSRPGEMERNPHLDFGHGKVLPKRILGPFAKVSKCLYLPCISADLCPPSFKFKPNHRFRSNLPASLPHSSSDMLMRMRVHLATKMLSTSSPDAGWVSGRVSSTLSIENEEKVQEVVQVTTTHLTPPSSVEAYWDVSSVLQT